MTPWPTAIKAGLQQSLLGGHSSREAVGASFGSAELPLRRRSSALLHIVAGYLRASWRWIEQKRTQQLSTRRLRLTETISLGEKRSVSIIQVNNVQYLIGHCAGSVQLLAQIDQPEDESPSTGQGSFIETKCYAREEGNS